LKTINLKGILIGNPFTNSKNDGINGTMEMLGNHAVFSRETKKNISILCSENFENQGCKDAIDNVMLNNMRNVNPCNIYDKCYYGGIGTYTNLDCSNFHKDPGNACIDVSLLKVFT